MPTWTNSPPETPGGHGLPLVRTPAQSFLEAIVTCEELIGTDTHFYGGHTIPCERPDCPACQDGIRYDWHGYVSALNPRDGLHFIFEMTHQAAGPFADFKANHGSLRCAQFHAYRWNKRRNGRVIVKVEMSATPSNALPAAPDLENVMSIIWRLPKPNVKILGVERGHRKVNATSDGNGQDSDPRLYETAQP